MSLKYILLWSLFSMNIPWCLSVSMTKKEQISNTGLLFDDETILISTLDGALIAVAKSSGRTKWILQNEPVIQSPTESFKSPMPLFFPNPQDGSLYRYVVGRENEPLKKLPFTIPELVANSPCRSSDGIFYLGKKMDSWVGVDSHTGKKQLILGMDIVDKVCPKPSRDTIYIGRTMYNIILFEPNSGHQWNVTFYHYSANPSSTGLKDYDLAHYTATGQGSLVTIDNASSTVMWSRDFPSPVISLYLLTQDGSLTSIPLTTVAPQTLDNVGKKFNIHNIVIESPDSSVTAKLSPTLFLGESADGVYAVPALVDEMTATISFRENHKLLGGPEGQQATIELDHTENPYTTNESSDLIIFGYYDVPNSDKSQLGDISEDELRDLADEGVLPPFNNNSKTFDRLKARLDVHIVDGFMQITNGNITFIASADFRVWLLDVMKATIHWMFSDISHAMFVIILCLIIFIFVVIYVHGQRYARLSREVSSQKVSHGSNLSTANVLPTAIPVQLDNGEIQVGKISFETTDILGKGCDGTFVFRGKFDGRNVAIKRILSGCFSIADREVELLRESDQHSNVIRYFCMEQCGEFRYIALELCSATVEDFVLGKFETKIKPVVIMHQMTAGLCHLHSLDIVHRDIKPSNILLSRPNSKGDVRAMISDFGLCRRLESGKVSFSKRSGVIGTDGWIAPEMMHSARPTTKVDIFSLGCVYYYILSKGFHPFGSVLNRQANICSGSYNLQKLNREEDPLPFYIIEKMVSPTGQDRPSTAALLKYPLFWSADLILQFFLDVSDRIEKEHSSSILIRNLEIDAGEVVRGGWLQYLHYCISNDLMKYRDYDNRSVRALLRALRNKKNHYRELSESAQSIFGHIPRDFVPYWTSRFPLLLIHSYAAMQSCKSEPVFTKYYNQTFIFKYSNFGTNKYVKPPHDEIGDLLDSKLGPIRKGPKKHPKMERKTNPEWKITSAEPNTFEPHYQQKL